MEILRLPTLLLFLVSLSQFVNCDFQHHHIIESPKLTNWGSFGELESCPVGTFVTGMQLKVEPAEGWKDDTGLNGIRLFCSRLGTSGKDETPTIISSSVGPFGEWKSIFRCEGGALNPETSAVVGFQLRIETPKGMKDDTSANNFRVFCKDLGVGEDREQNEKQGGESSGSEESEDTNIPPKHLVLEGDGTAWGEWTDSQLCRDGYAICGIATQVDHGHGDGYDDTGLNNVRAECCKIRFQDRDFHEERERPTTKLNNVLFPDPIESARNLQKTLLQMQKQNTKVETTPSSEPEPPADQRTVIYYHTPIISVPEVLKVDDPPTDNPPQYPAPQNRKEEISDHQLSEEISRLAPLPALDFGHPEVTTHFKIPSLPEDTAGNMDVHNFDEIPANPIPPPEVLQEIEPELKNGDEHPTSSIPTTKLPLPSTPTPPTRNNGRHHDSASGHNQLLIASGSSIYHPHHSFNYFGLHSMFFLALFANYVLL